MFAGLKRAYRAARAAFPAGKTGQRRFDAAVHDRLTASWLSTAGTIDQELRKDLDRLRSRSRDLFKNNEYAKRFGRMVRNNVVGAQGFTLMAASVTAAGKPDTADNAAIEAAWLRQCRPGNFEVTGQLSGDDTFRLLAVALARDGEVLIRELRGRGYGEFGWQLQVIDIDRLDTHYNVEATATSNAVVMGVEMDAFRRPVAYHINFNTGTGRQRERVPAAQILHRFIADDMEQARGYPWAHAVMRTLHDLHGYREAAVIAARVGASKMGIWETIDGEPPPGAEPGDMGDYVTSVEPGTFDFGPKGYKLSNYDPTYPHEQFDAFCKAALRGISSGLGVAYHGLANDLEGVNFSSIRSGVLEEREEWMVIQQWFISALLVPIFERWLPVALMSGKVVSANGVALPASKIDKFMAHSWQGRRWSWVDPMKDIQASILAIEAGLASPQQIAAQTGRDVEDVLDDIARFQEMVKAKGVTVGPQAAPAPANAAPPQDEDDKDDKDRALTREAFAELRTQARDLLAHSRQVTERPVVVELRNDPVQVHITQADTHLHLPEQRSEPQPAPIVNVHVEPAPVHVDVQPAQVTVEPAEVNVSLEATMPAPEVTVHLPPRKTETEIQRDSAGRISHTTQTERDA